MRALQRHLGLPQAHMLAQQGPASVLACTGSLLSALQQLTGSLAAAGAPAGRHYSAARRQVAAADSGVDGEGFHDEPEPVLTLPDLDTIGHLNPALRDAILKHQSQQQSASLADTMLRTLESALGPDAKQRPPRLNKTSLQRLRVDQLRGLLEELGGDSRGTKEGLVQRLLDMASGEQQQRQQQEAEARSSSAAATKGGVVSRRQLAAQAQVAKRLAEAVQRGGYGVPESSLREAHRQMVRKGQRYQQQAQQQDGQQEGQQHEQQSEYSHVFTPDDVADIFAEARADDICIIDVRGRCPFTDWMVLATARSQRLAHMLASAVLHQLKARAREVAPGVTPTIEGALDDSEWLVVDAGSVVAHVFLEGYRQEYALEQLWGAPDGRNIRYVQPRKTVHTLDSLR